MDKVVIFLAEGFEEVEALSVVDVLRRGNVEIVMMSIDDNLEIVGRNGIKVIADTVFNKDIVINSKMVVLPGGSLGTKNLKQSQCVGEIIKEFAKENKWIAAICAAPTVLSYNGVLDGYKATCFPGCEKDITDSTTMLADTVVCDRNIITSQGPATSIEFALTILEKLKGQDCVNAVKEGLLY